jgi:hypothetical protein
MGKKGHSSRRGVGEVDPEPRNASLFFKVTQTGLTQITFVYMKNRRFATGDGS